MGGVPFVGGEEAFRVFHQMEAGVGAALDRQADDAGCDTLLVVIRRNDTPGIVCALDSRGGLGG